MDGKAYATCTRCGKVWNISVWQKIPYYGYICPKCRYRR